MSRNTLRNLNETQAGALAHFSWTGTTLPVVPAHEDELDAFKWNRARTSAEERETFELLNATIIGVGLLLLDNANESSGGQDENFVQKMVKDNRRLNNNVHTTLEEFNQTELGWHRAMEMLRSLLWNADKDGARNLRWHFHPEGKPLDIPRLRRSTNPIARVLGGSDGPVQRQVGSVILSKVREVEAYLAPSHAHEHNEVRTLELQYTLAVARYVLKNQAEVMVNPTLTYQLHAFEPTSSTGTATVFDPISREERDRLSRLEAILDQTLTKLDASPIARKLIPEFKWNQTTTATEGDVKRALKHEAITEQAANKLLDCALTRENEAYGRINDFTKGKFDGEEALRNVNALIGPASEDAFRAFKLTATDAEIKDNQLDVARLRAATNTVYTLLEEFEKAKGEAEVGVCEAVRDVIQQVDGYLDKAQFTDVATLELQFLINIARYVLN